MTSPENLIKRAQKLKRRESFLTLLDALQKRTLEPSERQRFLSTVMAKTLSGEFTPHEARQLTKGV
jgi:hypothetical protein